MSFAVAQLNQILQKLQNGSDIGSVTLTRDSTRPGQSRWPGDPVTREPKTRFQHCSASTLHIRRKKITSEIRPQYFRLILFTHARAHMHTWASERRVTSSLDGISKTPVRKFTIRLRTCEVIDRVSKNRESQATGNNKIPTMMDGEWRATRRPVWRRRRRRRPAELLTAVGGHPPRSAAVKVLHGCVYSITPASSDRPTLRCRPLRRHRSLPD